MTSNKLPSPKQLALLEFIDGFIQENNYAPSYRETMRALEYRSVSTVAKHIDSLIERGWLVKRDNEKRSVEVVYKAGQSGAENSPAPSRLGIKKSVSAVTEAELIERLEAARNQVEVGATYVHFKGNKYEVVDLVIQTVDDEVGVMYRALYGAQIVFVRPLKEWLETVECDGRAVPRFEKAA